MWWKSNNACSSTYVLQTQLLPAKKQLQHTLWKTLRGSFLHVVFVSLEPPVDIKHSATLKLCILKTLQLAILVSFVTKQRPQEMLLAVIWQENIKMSGSQRVIKNLECKSMNDKPFNSSSLLHQDYNCPMTKILFQMLTLRSNQRWARMRLENGNAMTASKHQEWKQIFWNI